MTGHTVYATPWGGNADDPLPAALAGMVTHLRENNGLLRGEERFEFGEEGFDLAFIIYAKAEHGLEARPNKRSF